ncbi:MAG: family acetyltransferase [Nocardioides sp.]|nr:family acetyltransferase [Nocardioides sp.]
MALAVDVRTATLDDLDAVLAVGHACWWATYEPIAGADHVERGLATWWTPETNRPAIEAGRVLVAEVDDRVLAMASSSLVDDHVVVWRLYVLPEAQGLGIGTRLLDAVEAAAPAQAVGLRLSHLEGNDKARDYYVRQGFVATGERVPGALGGPDDLTMRRPLRR